MAVKTLYSVLGVDPAASQEDIDDAFIRLKLQHPQAKIDTDENARIRFAAIQQAYETLKNPDARSAYDQRIKRAGVKVANSSGAMAVDDAPGLMSLRNLVVAGLIVIVISGMWWYHARQVAREEAAAIQRALKIVEDEKRKRAELAEAEEARRQANFEASQQRMDEARERQQRQEAERYARQVSNEARNEERTAEMRRRQEKSEQDRRLQYEQNARQQAERDAQRQAQLRIENEKRQLREMCMQRYRRPDC
jgi:flagellar biosynthesis GTPase FlhF